jgi:signal peptidase I
MVDPAAGAGPTGRDAPTPSFARPPLAPAHADGDAAPDVGHREQLPFPEWPVPREASAYEEAAVEPPAFVFPRTTHEPIRDPVDDPANWGPPLPPAPEEPAPRRSIGQVLWPWGIRGVVETVEVLALALLMFLFVRSIGQNFVVDGGSMEPTFQNGEMLIVNKLVYRSFDISWLPWSDDDDWRPFGEPQPGDVVVFQFPQNTSRDFIKRVVAVAGQTVEIRSGEVIIDGVVRNEPYLGEPPAYDYGPITVAEGQYFVLGDNRNNSYDSHAWGTLGESFLIGRADIRYWPLSRAGRVDDAAPQTVPEIGVARSP